MISMFILFSIIGILVYLVIENRSISKKFDSLLNFLTSFNISIPF
jgi:hypothetical protein